MEDEDPLRPMTYVDIGSVDLRFGIGKTKEMVFEDSPSRARRLVRDGDTIISTVRTYLRAIAPIRRPPSEMVVSTGFAVVRPTSGDPAFMYWALREHGFVEAIVARSVGVSYPAINPSEIGTLPLPQPQVSEQRAIAAYLDRETARIDELISKQELLIERLDEYRAALITRTVTCGLPPEAAEAAGLDPTPRLQDSGVEWLGQVPSHWSIARLKWSAEYWINGVWGDEPDGTDDLLCVRVADFDRRSSRISFDTPTYRHVPESQRGNRMLNAGDLLLEKSGGGPKQLVGCVVLYDHELPAVCSNFVGRVVLADGADPTFWAYVHKALYAGRLNYPAIKQTTGIQNLDASAYFDLLVAHPPFTEQRAIADYLDSQSTRIDALREKAEVSIERLSEYRSALISAAVTGKIDVRGAAQADSGAGV
ncbi:hypothetical protein [Candidatus Poriferisodalis sp.]|uniref:hypothetical protein n=1 Tax=Candidatus Poriferisodalis sp. TaxID=3101277 RepID=UPI003B018F37